MSKTAVISIGNSDDKLAQVKWSKFISDVNWIISRYQLTVHFSGFSSPTAPWQNACWVVEMPENLVHQFKFELARIATKYLQDSIAFVLGDTEFINGG